METRDFDNSWETHCAELAKFIRVNGIFDRIVLRKTQPELCMWVDSVIADRDNLTEYQKMKLKSIGLAVKKDKPVKNESNQWERMYPALRAYKRVFGTFTVVKQNDKDLYNWVQWVKSNKDQLSTEQLDKLKQLGVKWLRGSNIWESKFKELKDFHEKYGHFTVKRSDNVNLHAWLRRQLMAAKKGTLDTRKHQRLVEMGVI